MLRTLQEFELWWEIRDGIWIFCLIIGSFALTLMADATRVPKKTPTLFWQHWWHTPLLIYTNIAVLYPLWLLSLALIRPTILAEAAATVSTYPIVGAAWLFLTQHTSQPLSKRGDESLSATTITLVVGTVLSLLGLLPLVLHSLGFWVFAPLRLWTFSLAPWLTLAGLVIYAAGVLLRLYRENIPNRQIR